MCGCRGYFLAGISLVQVQLCRFCNRVPKWASCVPAHMANYQENNPLSLKDFFFLSQEYLVSNHNTLSQALNICAFQKIMQLCWFKNVSRMCCFWLMITCNLIFLFAYQHNVLITYKYHCMVAIVVIQVWYVHSYFAELMCSREAEVINLIMYILMVP